MYIYAINIKNFRSFKHIWVFPNRDVNVIVGPNNCGKSTILRALSLALDPAVNFRQPNLISRFDFHKSKTDEPIEITVWLKPVMLINNQGKPEFIDSDSIKLSFYDKLSTWQVETVGRTLTSPNENHPVRLVPLSIDPMQKPEDISEHERLLVVRLQAGWNEAIEAAETDVNIVDEVGNELTPLSNKHKDVLGFKLVGARRNPLYELSLSRQSLLSKIVDEDDVTTALRGLLEQLEDGKTELLNKQSINKLMQRLSKLIAPELMGALVNNLGTDFSLTFLGGDLWRLRGATSIATNMALDDQKKFSLPLEFQGDGAQNLILMAHLIDLLRERTDNDIVVLEEPEQNLEPALSRWIFGELCSLTQKQSQQAGQIFITTHSPSLVGELKGPETLLIFSDCADFLGTTQKEASEGIDWQIISATNLPSDVRKKLDQNGEKYIPALFAKQALIVEGRSEMGFLPVAFRYFSTGSPGKNPFHLGLEIVDGDSKVKSLNHALMLRSYGRKCHLLFDNDADDTQETKDQYKSKMNGQVDFVTCWPEEDLLPFTPGCDLEVIIARYVVPNVLFQAIKLAYEDAGHAFIERCWRDACAKVKNLDIVKMFPDVTNDNFNLSKFELASLGDESVQRAFLFSLLHGPHDCKSTKDMRLIATYLSEQKAIPEIFDDLRNKILQSITTPEKVDHNAPYLAAR